MDLDVFQTALRPFSVNLVQAPGGFVEFRRPDDSVLITVPKATMTTAVAAFIAGCERGPIDYSGEHPNKLMEVAADEYRHGLHDAKNWVTRFGYQAGLQRIDMELSVFSQLTSSYSPVETRQADDTVPRLISIHGDDVNGSKGWDVTKGAKIVFWLRRDDDGVSIELDSRTFTPKEFFRFVDRQFQAVPLTQDAQRDALRMVVEVLRTGKFTKAAVDAGWDSGKILKTGMRLFSEAPAWLVAPSVAA